MSPMKRWSYRILPEFHLAGAMQKVTFDPGSLGPIATCGFPYPDSRELQPRHEPGTIFATRYS